MKLNELRDNEGARKSRMRVGRGTSSGKGKTAGRGVKGQKSRSGVAIKGFEGGQMPIHMRLPKRGFNVPNPTKLNAVNLERLQMAVDAGKIAKGSLVTAASLVEAGVLRRVKDGVRILAKGELTAKLDFEVAGVSKAAVEVIEKLGGKVTILKKAIPVVEKTARVAADKAADVASSDDA
ncbi:50S ribosomal protein L15 [Alphaproteobacteria bacterium]|nr:50S ribosomal protein L15 [Alphaproteobacteria bacterium]